METEDSGVVMSEVMIASKIPLKVRKKRDVCIKDPSNKMVTKPDFRE